MIKSNCFSSKYTVHLVSKYRGQAEKGKLIFLWSYTTGIGPYKFHHLLIELIALSLFRFKASKFINDKNSQLFCVCVPMYKYKVHNFSQIVWVAASGLWLVCQGLYSVLFYFHLFWIIKNITITLYCIFNNFTFLSHYEL